MKQTTGQPEPRYKVVAACAASLVGPVTAVRRADHLPMLQAWAVHLIGGVMVLMVSLFLAAWENDYGPGSLLGQAGSLSEALEDVAAFLRHPAGWAVLIFGFFFIEFGWWLSALVTMSWSARDEPLRLSHRRALRRLYLLTPHLATIVAVAGGTMILIERADWLEHIWYDASNAGQMAAFILACLWSLRVVLCALDCQPARPYCLWPARCAQCGYQLTGLSRDRGCPECGLALNRTLDRHTRPGMDGPGGAPWWINRTYRSVRRPTALGGAMHVLSPDHGYKRCLTFTIATLMLLSIPAMSGIYAIVETVNRLGGYGYGSFEWDEFAFVSLIVGLWMGLLLTGTMMATLLVGSGIAGMLEGWRSGRNLMPAAVRAACYLSGFTVFWAIIFWLDLVFFIIIMELELLKPIVMKYNIAEQDLVMVWQGGVILLGIVIYLTLLGKATRAARYANW